MVENLKKAKKLQHDFLVDKCDKAMSSYCLYNKQATLKAVEMVLETLQGSKYLSSYTINNILVSLHQGKLELDYEAKLIQNMYDTFYSNLDKFADKILIECNK